MRVKVKVRPTELQHLLYTTTTTKHQPSCSTSIQYTTTNHPLAYSTQTTNHQPSCSTPSASSTNHPLTYSTQTTNHQPTCSTSSASSLIRGSATCSPHI